MDEMNYNPSMKEINEVPTLTMQEKQIYRVKDIKTSNPRKLFRHLSDTLEEWGYKTNFSSDSITIKRDEVGDSGYVNTNFSANKVIQREGEGEGGLALGFSGSSKVKRYGLIIGAAILLVSGVAGFGVGIAIGIIALVVTLLSMLKREAGTVHYQVTVWVMGTGEIYRAQLSESRSTHESEQGIAQEQISSELSVRIAAESEPPTELNELQVDVERLLVKLESFSE